MQYDATWRRRLSDILDFGERAVAVIAALLALATLLVIGNTVRTDIQARAEEIAVMQLIGAGRGFVRRPFLYTGLWYGLLGGASRARRRDRCGMGDRRPIGPPAGEL